jgi:hypothetical protein
MEQELQEKYSFYRNTRGDVKSRLIIKDTGIVFKGCSQGPR